MWKSSIITSCFSEDLVSALATSANAFAIALSLVVTALSSVAIVASWRSPGRLLGGDDGRIGSFFGRLWALLGAILGSSGAVLGYLEAISLRALAVLDS